jgi:FKBP-type peptidyl-prolyl cis-trans isomerase
MEIENAPPPTMNSSTNNNNSEEWIDVGTKQDGGILKKILQASPDGADGPPPKGTIVSAHYTGCLKEDGSDKFDSSVDRGKPFEFTIGNGQVIQGWDQGFASMGLGKSPEDPAQGDPVLHGGAAGIPRKNQGEVGYVVGRTDRRGPQAQSEGHAAI